MLLQLVMLLLPPLLQLVMLLLPLLLQLVTLLLPLLLQLQKAKRNKPSFHKSNCLTFGF
jgi:phosphopantetheinyl transferase